MLIYKLNISAKKKKMSVSSLFDSYFLNVNINKYFITFTKTRSFQMKIKIIKTNMLYNFYHLSYLCSRYETIDNRLIFMMKCKTALHVVRSTYGVEFTDRRVRPA